MGLRSRSPRPPVTLATGVGGAPSLPFPHRSIWEPGTLSCFLKLSSLQGPHQLVSRLFGDLDRRSSLCVTRVFATAAGEPGRCVGGVQLSLAAAAEGVSYLTSWALQAFGFTRWPGRGLASRTPTRQPSVVGARRWVAGRAPAPWRRQVPPAAHRLRAPPRPLLLPKLQVHRRRRCRVSDKPPAFTAAAVISGRQLLRYS